MSARDVTAGSVLELRERMDESTMDDRWCAKSVCEEAIDALEASRAEVAALRRQLEERGDAAPEFDVNRLDGLEGAWAEGNLRVYIAGARAGWEKCASLIRISPGDVVATPPPDMVKVPREHLAEWITAMRCSEPYVACGCDNTQKRLDAIESMARALRSGEAGKGAR